MEKYEVLDLEVLGFESCDVITESEPPEIGGDPVSN